MPIYYYDTRRTTGSEDFANPSEDISAEVADSATDVTRYWGPSGAELFFGCTFTRIQSLSATTGQVALRVTRLTNPNRVSGRWVTFNPASPPNATRSSYFVLDSDGIRRFTTEGRRNNNVLALIRRDVHGNIYVHFRAVRIGDISGGGAAGVTIPQN